MTIQQLENEIIKQKINDFTGLSGLASVRNSDIEEYFYGFMDWLIENKILEKVNNYSEVNLTLQYINSDDFIVWILHFGDVYANLRERYSEIIYPNGLDKSATNQLKQLKKINPKYSFLVALTHHLKSSQFYSDRDINKLDSLLKRIPNNNNSKIKRNSALGQALFDSLYTLSNYGIERMVKKSI
ncbi:MAG TPA: hypothetical protein K8V88_04205 [Companilactobacillus farciminis]|uniref:Uncharacterized protein n=1 Tax=Companilactobacillus farciminis TaxID=1612 RepID=A0A921HT60_9LACO|nr:hypothetical protein [Companilactobacillus farciminis]